jgi:hypothetical protein
MNRHCCVPGCFARIYSSYLQLKHVSKFHREVLVTQEIYNEYVHQVRNEWSSQQQAQPVEWLFNEPVIIRELRLAFGNDPCAFIFPDEKREGYTLKEYVPGRETFLNLLKRVESSM